MNVAMWQKALKVIPSVSKGEWDHLDLVSKWLISTRAAVLVMTLTSSILAGLFALRDEQFHVIPWLALTIGLLMAHAANNLFNDFTDYVRGVDQGNYYRTMYGPQPLAHGLMTKRQHLLYFALSGSVALLCGLYLVWYNGADQIVWGLLSAGAFLLLFYTWPLKYIAMGELSVLLVWGPLMIGGGYYVITHNWDWNVIWAGIVYALGVTTVIFGKHIDKIQTDRDKNIHTLPAIIGEKTSRYFVIGMMVLPYFMIAYLVVIKYFTPLPLIVLMALPRLRQILPAFMKQKPETRPQNFPEGQGGWPLYFAPLAFGYNRSFGMLFIIGIAADVIVRILFAL